MVYTTTHVEAIIRAIIMAIINDIMEKMNISGHQSQQIGLYS